MTSSDSANETVILIIAGDSLAGRSSSLLRKEEEEELRFLLRSMSQEFAQMTVNGSSAREMVHSRHSFVV